jgi:23S rRNA (cytidine1920-2'-O)/16S rRNA (cytidine1409-2'-O)-methyltransferase
VGDERLDVALVQRGLARSRTQAERLLREGRVRLDGAPVSKASRRVADGVDLAVEVGERPDYVGRGALKLAGVLDDLAASGAAPEVSGRRCLDAGASTGGFTEVLLERGAREVLAVDVGHGQLAAPLRADDRVRDLEGVTVRGLRPPAIAGPVELLVADLSFISLQVVLPDLVALVGPGGDLLLLVKPQFEVGRARLGSGGVVRDRELRVSAVVDVIACGQRLGLRFRSVRASRWPGPSGNVEYFVWFASPDAVGDVPAASTSDHELSATVRRAVEEGPS